MKIILLIRAMYCTADVYGTVVVPDSCNPAVYCLWGYGGGGGGGVNASIYV